jgi:hypothetical protein
MDQSTGLETEYLTDVCLRRNSSLKTLPFIGPYQPNTPCDDLALSCELYRLAYIHRTQLEETPIKLALLALLHFRRNPHSEVQIVYESSESIGVNRICRDPLYAAYYSWFQQVLDFINTLVVSWGLWPMRGFSHRQAAAQEKNRFGTLVGKGKGMSLGFICLAGCYKKLDIQHSEAAEAFETVFEDLANGLIALNKEADLTQVSTLEERIYQKAFRLVTTQQLTQIVPETHIIPRSLPDIKRFAGSIGLYLLQRPPAGLLQCCFAAGDMGLEAALDRVVQVYALWERHRE